MVIRDWAKDWELCQRGTPKPWIIKRKEIVYSRGNGSYIRVVGPEYVNPEKLPQDRAIEVYVPPEREDMEFIVGASEALPYWLQRVKKLETLLVKALEILQEIGGAEPVFEDERLDYVEIQVDRATLDEIQELRRQLEEETYFHKEMEKAAADYIAELEQRVRELEKKNKKLEWVLEVVIREMLAYAHGWRASWADFDGRELLYLQLKPLAEWAKKALAGEKVDEYMEGTIFWSRKESD